MLDKKDLEIIRVLKENAKLSTQQISKKTKIPITTVHHRIKKLEQNGIIKSYTVVLDNKQLGKTLAAYILITVDYKLLKQNKISQQDLSAKLKKMDLVEEVDMITGGSDIILKIRVKDVDQMDEFVTKTLRNIDGIEKTQTMVILHEF